MKRSIALIATIALLISMLGAAIITVGEESPEVSITFVLNNKKIEKSAIIGEKAVPPKFIVDETAFYRFVRWEPKDLTVKEAGQKFVAIFEPVNEEAIPLEELDVIVLANSEAPAEPELPVEEPAEAEAPAEPELPAEEPAEVEAPADPELPAEEPAEIEAPAEPELPAEEPVEVEAPAEPELPAEEPAEIEAPAEPELPAGLC